MRTVFLLLQEHHDGELEILYSFGMTRPARSTIRKVATEYPEATHFGSMPDTEERLRIRRIYKLKDMARWERDEKD